MGEVLAGEKTIYRQSWKEGKPMGSPEAALKVPFAFKQVVTSVVLLTISRRTSSTIV